MTIYKKEIYGLEHYYIIANELHSAIPMQQAYELISKDGIILKNV